MVFKYAWCLHRTQTAPSSCLNGASRTKARCTKWQRTVTEPRCNWCFKNCVIRLKRCFLFKNHENPSMNFNHRRNFSRCAPLRALSILDNTVYYSGEWDQNLSKKWHKMASFNSTTFRSQRFHYFLALCRKYVLAVMHIYCTAIVQKIKLLYY